MFELHFAAFDKRNVDPLFTGLYTNTRTGKWNNSVFYALIIDYDFKILFDHRYISLLPIRSKHFCTLRTTLQHLTAKYGRVGKKWLHLFYETFSIQYPNCAKYVKKDEKEKEGKNNLLAWFGYNKDETYESWNYFKKHLLFMYVNITDKYRI